MDDISVSEISKALKELADFVYEQGPPYRFAGFDEPFWRHAAFKLRVLAKMKSFDEHNLDALLSNLDTLNDAAEELADCQFRLHNYSARKGDLTKKEQQEFAELPDNIKKCEDFYNEVAAAVNNEIEDYNELMDAQEIDSKLKD